LNIDDFTPQVVPDERVLRRLFWRVHRVDIFSVAIRDPGDAEKLQIAGKSGLCDLDPFLLQTLEELLLAVDLLRAQNPVDQPSSRFLALQIGPPFRPLTWRWSLRRARTERCLLNGLSCRPAHLY
jgi:hypothetical protein